MGNDAGWPVDRKVRFDFLWWRSGQEPEDKATAEMVQEDWPALALGKDSSCISKTKGSTPQYGSVWEIYVDGQPICDGRSAAYSSIGGGLSTWTYHKYDKSACSYPFP